MHKLVKINFPTNRNIKFTSKLDVITFKRVFVPNPKTSSKNNPTIPQANPAIIGDCQFFIPANDQNLFITSINFMQLLLPLLRQMDQ